MLRVVRSLKSIKFSGAIGSKRAFSAPLGHHNDHKAPPGPYDVPHHHPNREEAFLWGEDPKDPRTTKKQGWEFITHIVYLASAAVFIYGIWAKGVDPYQVLLFNYVKIFVA
jgi:hypothetical protein